MEVIPTSSTLVDGEKSGLEAEGVEVEQTIRKDLKEKLGPGSFILTNRRILWRPPGGDHLRLLLGSFFFVIFEEWISSFLKRNPRAIVHFLRGCSGPAGSQEGLV